MKRVLNSPIPFLAKKVKSSTWRRNDLRVEIPFVHESWILYDASPEETDESATTIQRYYRGYVVRTDKSINNTNNIRNV